MLNSLSSVRNANLEEHFRRTMLVICVVFDDRFCEDDARVRAFLSSFSFFNRTKFPRLSSKHSIVIVFVANLPVNSNRRQSRDALIDTENRRVF